MASNFYGATSLTGGGAGALDGIDGALLSDLDAAFVVILGKAYFYTLDDDSAAAEASPTVIAPDDNAGTKRWVLAGLGIPVGAVGAPSLSFGDGDSGFYEIGDDRIVFATLGTRRVNMETGFWEAQDSNGWRLENDDASATVPVFVFGSDTDTGLGRAGADALSLIAGGVEGMRLTETAGDVAVAITDRIALPQTDEAATPTIAFGNGDTGFYERLDDHLSIAIAGNYRGRLTNTVFVSATGFSFSMLFAAGSATVPTYGFNTDEDTGVGRAAADTLSLIAGGVEGIRIEEAAAAIKLGFYSGTTPVALQTGVAVTSAGIHAALVNLGLITA